MHGMTDIIQIKNRITELIDEVKHGLHTKDILINSSYDFSGEMQALYFSNMRKNMKSEMADSVMNHKQQLADLKMLEVVRKSSYQKRIKQNWMNILSCYYTISNIVSAIRR